MICPPVEQDLTWVKALVALLVGIIVGREVGKRERPED